MSVLTLQLWNLESARVDDNLHEYLGPLCKCFDLKKDYESVLGAEWLLKRVVYMIFKFVLYTLLFFFFFFSDSDFLDWQSYKDACLETTGTGI